jgi:DMSO/TMAO reductase YedYZ molybdopterin-dependent catalytic subunit
MRIDRAERSRRHVLGRLLAAATAALLAGCDAASRSSWFPKVLGVGERASRGAQRLASSRRSMAQEFSAADLSPQFRSNGTADPDNPQYQALAAAGFAEWRLQIDGLVQRPLQL